jgi:hypothetical protein
MSNSEHPLNPVVEEIKAFADSGWPFKQTPHLKIAQLYRRFIQKERELQHSPESSTREFSQLFKKSDPWARPYAILSTISPEVEEKIGTADGMLKAPLPDIADVLKSDKKDWLLDRVTPGSDFRQHLKEFWKHYYGYQEKDENLSEVTPAPTSSAVPSKCDPKPKPEFDVAAPAQPLPSRIAPAPIPVPVLSKLETEEERVRAMREFFQLKSFRREPKKCDSLPKPEPLQEVARPIPAPADADIPPKNSFERSEALTNALVEKKPAKQRFRVTGRKNWPSYTEEAEPFESQKKERNEKGYVSKVNKGKYY